MPVYAQNHYYLNAQYKVHTFLLMYSFQSWSVIAVDTY